MTNKRKVFLIGNAHLDPVWLWRWQEGFAEIKATFRSALDRMKEFPEFIFSCAGAAYYKWVEENCPEMFAEIQERVREGRWIIVGGWWLQPDCNLPCGEAFARHGLYGQRYFFEKFGVTAKVGYNVDSFGHHGMLPQILKKSGMDYYIFMRPGDHEKELPGNLFWWESADGSRVMTFKIPYNYGNWWYGEGEPVEQKIAGVMGMAEEQDVDLMNFYGVGNHGGGPTVANLEAIRQFREQWGTDRLLVSDPNAYFAEVSNANPSLAVVKDDLQHHASGCYAAHSETKANNRKAELRLISAEKFAAVAHRVKDYPSQGAKLKTAWEDVMFNQFHDILGGCSLREAYDDAREFYGEALKIGAEVMNGALQKMSWSIDTMREGVRVLSKDKDWILWEKEDKGIPLVVFNPLSWDRKAAVQVNRPVKGVTDDAGNPLELQSVRASRTNEKDKWDTLFVGDIPAMGYRVFWVYRDRSMEPPAAKGMLEAGEYFMENEWIRMVFEPHTGYLSSLFYKETGVELLASRGAVPIVIDEYDSDTWAHGIFTFNKVIGRFADAKIKLLEKGPLRVRIRVTSCYNQSVLRQDFILYRHKPEIEVHVKLDWREKHKMLTLSFPANVSMPQAVYEIPYGFIRRPANGEEEPGQQWVDISGVYPQTTDIYGLTLLNNSKYSCSVHDNDLRMTVARSPIFADQVGDRDEYCEFMDQGIQEFQYSIALHKGKWQEADIVRKASELNTPVEQVMETYHAGSLPLYLRGVSIDHTNIIVSAFKLAEDGTGYILRCYESAGWNTKTTIRLDILQAIWDVEFTPCEIKTFWISRDGREIHEKNLLEW